MDGITDKTVMTTLREVVAERPDFVYKAQTTYSDDDATPMCGYVHTNENGAQIPGCLVGHVLAKLGIPLDTLADFEGRGAHTVVRGLDLNLSQQTERVLWIAQVEQDSGKPWGEALAEAEAAAA